MSEAATPALKGPPNNPQKAPGRVTYQGYVAGVFSGLAKTTVGHPFDTIKVRLQTTGKSHFKGPLDCLVQTLRKEGIRGVYKGFTPPAVGWGLMDSIMMGSLALYRQALNDNFFNPRKSPWDEQAALPVLGHAIAGTMAGWTVSFVAAPVEHIKARLQVQYQADKSKRLYSGPIDCLRKTYHGHGVRGVFHGLTATLVFRSFFCFWWGTYPIYTDLFKTHTNFSTPAVQFWAGGISAMMFWITSYPSDVIKQRVMTDPLGPQRRFPRWRDAAKAIWKENGWRGYWRGFLPCFLRAFPANAAAVAVWEAVMRQLPT
ncbi:mitochondrial carnitine/acylcarnitine carrier protein [Polyplosphaeria fusca]|uniref:Mitochondrial carnitine/acylcarnitine carrier protein n=1 Tax=Polyplosphaeria fusca TaxID=682080 RepID=A0A9P4RB62_9PLEO|nr:mitochondrial carnitine/acylcarnitine carrier protein [Polyplosphaeria fusca]